jgi:predicted translin family RNA/ssDNA-binding protein
MNGLEQRVVEQATEIVRLTKVASDLTEANRQKHNRIEHQKKHIKRLQESIAKLKQELKNHEN